MRENTKGVCRATTHKKEEEVTMTKRGLRMEATTKTAQEVTDGDATDDAVDVSGDAMDIGRMSRATRRGGCLGRRDAVDVSGDATDIALDVSGDATRWMSPTARRRRGGCLGRRDGHRKDVSDGPSTLLPSVFLRCSPFPSTLHHFIHFAISRPYNQPPRLLLSTTFSLRPLLSFFLFNITVNYSSIRRDC